MPGPLACILSYGLVCTPLEDVDVSPPAGQDPAGDQDGPAAEPAKGKATLLLAKVHAFHNDTTDLTADFKQTYVHPVYGTKRVMKGKLRVKKPSSMVWDYAEADAADVWVTGKSVYVVEQDTRQVIHRVLGSSDFAGAEKFLFGGRELIHDFKAKIASETLQKRYAKGGEIAVLLMPKKKNPHYKKLTLVVDEATGRVTTFVVLNNDNSTNQFDLSSHARNVGLPNSDFKFVKPKGFVLIRE